MHYTQESYELPDLSSARELVENLQRHCGRLNTELDNLRRVLEDFFEHVDRLSQQVDLIDESSVERLGREARYYMPISVSDVSRAADTVNEFRDRIRF